MGTLMWKKFLQSNRVVSEEKAHVDVRESQNLLHESLPVFLCGNPASV